VWLAAALLDYIVFPYDLEAAAAGVAPHWVAWRLFANTLITFSYVSFWHLALYWCGYGRRPFNPERSYRWSKVLHNVWYNVLAVVQWTIWEVVFMRAWATGRLPYLHDDQAFGTLSGALTLVLSFWWVPLWRSWHFYFAHRLLHVRPLYKFVHSLHHRNTDIEPFAGLCMHPIEHLYYFACFLPSVYVFASPFALMWNGVHLLLSPAASHSGFEDNFQSDQFHYLHHMKFECNYGPSDCPLDRWFGTFKDKIDQKTPTHTEHNDDAVAARVVHSQNRVIDPKSTLAGLPEPSFVVYSLLAVVLPAYALCVALMDPTAHNRWSVGAFSGAQLVAALVGGGPVLVAVAMLALNDPNALAARARQALTAPFHKERLAGALGLHLVVGMAITVMPVYHIVHTALADPGQAAYCSLPWRNC